MCPFCGGWYGGGGGLGFIINLLFTLMLIAGIVLLVWWLARRYRPEGFTGATPQSRALDTLNERYAKGELSTEEYEERKRVLSR